MCKLNLAKHAGFLVFKRVVKIANSEVSGFIFISKHVLEACVKVRNEYRRAGRSIMILHIFKTYTTKVFSRQKKAEIPIALILACLC